MSDYRQCRACGADLLRTGCGVGANECCCDRGYCLACCPTEIDPAVGTPGGSE